MRPALALLALVATLGAASSRADDAPAPARDPHDYSTAERVTYVEACMRDHPGGHYEMLNKCSCALDTIMSAVPFDDYDTLSTAFKAGTIAGERGGEFRDSPVMQDRIKKFRTLQADAQKACMIAPPPAR